LQLLDLQLARVARMAYATPSRVARHPRRGPTSAGPGALRSVATADAVLTRDVRELEFWGCRRGPWRSWTAELELDGGGGGRVRSGGRRRSGRDGFVAVREPRQAEQRGEALEFGPRAGGGRWLAAEQRGEGPRALELGLRATAVLAGGGGRIRGGGEALELASEP
jgi:hypothetical protein